MSTEALKKYYQRGGLPVRRWFLWLILGIACIFWLAIHLNLLGSLLLTEHDDNAATSWETVVLPTGRPQYEWGSGSDGMQFEPLLEFLVQMNSSPPESSFTDFVPLIIRNGELLHSNVKTNALMDKYPGFRGRYPGRVFHAEDMIHEAIQIGLHWMEREPRFRAVVDGKDGGLPLLLRHADDPGCGENKHLMAAMTRANDNTASASLSYPIPYLSWCTHVDCHYSWPIVSYNLWERYANPMKYGTVMQQKDWRRQFAFQNWWYSWKSKIRKAVWRGSPTGNWIVNDNKDDINSLPRVQLVRLGMQHPDLIDAGFTTTTQIHPDKVKAFRSEMPMVRRTTLDKQQRYKAIIDIDGNTWSARFGEQLCLNSVTIKVEPAWVDSFYKKDLVPWVHYVPANMSNLIEMVKYVVADDHDLQMQRIVRNANKWCETAMTKSQMAITTLWTLVFYVELLDKGNPNWREVWKRNATAYHLPSLQMTSVDQIHARWKSIGRRKRWFPFL